MLSTSFSLSPMTTQLIIICINTRQTIVIEGMEESSCFKHFVFLGAHPDRPMSKLRIIFDCSLVVCMFVSSEYKAYTDKAVVDRVSGLLIMSILFCQNKNIFTCFQSVIKH